MINSPISVRSEGSLRSQRWIRLQKSQGLIRTRIFLPILSTEWHHTTWHGQSLILTIHWLLCLDRIVFLTLPPLHLVELYQIFDFNFLVSNIHVTFDNPQFYERVNVLASFVYQLIICKNLGEVFFILRFFIYLLNWFQILTK